MTIEAEDYLPKRVKLISLGDAGAGKSAIIKVNTYKIFNIISILFQRHCEHRFVSRYVMTIGIDYGVIKIANKNPSEKSVTVSIFDVGGHEAFQLVRSQFYEESEVIF